eukprot:808765-Pyramimonas_sp.AAC.1
MTKYLGCWLVPGADLARLWHDSLSKYAARMRALGANALHNDAVARAYKGLEIPCLLDVAMMPPIPD